MRRGHILRLVTGVVVIWAMAMLAAGCSGGDDGSASTETSIGGGPVEVTPSSEAEVSVLTTLDKLTTFRSKDPFIPQVVAPPSVSSTTVSTIPTTTTTLPPVTTASTTTSTTSTTTTTIPTYVLTLLEVNAGPPDTVKFSINSWEFTGQPEGGVVSGAWGVIEVDAIVVGPPESVTFFHNGPTTQYILDLNLGSNSVSWQ